MEKTIVTHNTYQLIMGKINYGLFLLIVVLLPYPQLMLRWACSAWIISWFLEGRWLQRANIRSWRQIIPFALFATWYAYSALSCLWAANQDAACFRLECYQAFALLLPIGIWGVNSNYQITQIQRILVFTCLLAVPIYLFTMFWVFNYAVVWDQSNPTTMVAEWMPTSFFVEQTSNIKHRLFLCMVEILGIMAIWQRREELQLRYGKSAMWVICLLETAVMCTLIVLSGSRASLVAGILIVSLVALFHLPRRHRIIGYILVALLTMLLSIALWKYHPRMQNVSPQQLTSEQLDDQREPRLNIWHIALSNCQDYWLIGLGAGQATPYLEQCYKSEGLDRYILCHYSTHNQYLHELMELGIFGLTLFLLAWVSIIVCTQGKQRRWAILTVLFFAIDMLTEDIFGRFDGIALWSIWIIAIILLYNPQPDKTPAL